MAAPLRLEKPPQLPLTPYYDPGVNFFALNSSDHTAGEDGGHRKQPKTRSEIRKALAGHRDPNEAGCFSGIFICYKPRRLFSFL